MLAHLIAFGAFDESSELEPGFGLIEATTDVVEIARTFAVGGVGSGIPLNAFEWKRPLDPSDRAFYAFDWTPFLNDGESIASIETITMSALGASLGVMIDDEQNRLPIIDVENKLVGLWFKVDAAFRANPAFADAGTRVGVAMLVRTDASPYKEYERTAVLLVRQQ